MNSLGAALSCSPAFVLFPSWHMVNIALGSRQKQMKIHFNILVHKIYVVEDLPKGEME